MQGMVGMSMGEFARDVVVRDSKRAGIADSHWRTDSVVRERVYCLPGLVLIELIFHEVKGRAVRPVRRDGTSSPEGWGNE